MGMKSRRKKMPARRLKCNQCKGMSSLMWRKINAKEQICNDCYEKNKKHLKNELEPTSKTAASTTMGAPTRPAAVSKADEKKGRLRKSTRSTRYNAKTVATPPAPVVIVPPPPPKPSISTAPPKPSAQPKASASKNTRGRRTLLRRNPIKAPTITATTSYVKSLFYKGYYYQIGDIVSLCNSKYDTFYAQIRGLIVDSFCEKSAVLTWLIPTQISPLPNDGFDPSTYLIGPEEDTPRLLSCMEFIMHAPSDYYQDKTTPYPPTDNNVLSTFATTKGTDGGFIWTNLYPRADR